MNSLYYQPQGYWFGDCMPFFHDGKFYLYHQRDTRKPGPFGEPFGWALAITTDFVHYEDLGEVLLHGSDDEQDQFIFAGSVFEAGGIFYALYTGFNREYQKQGKPSQVLMIATSTDLIHWTKTDEKLVPPQAGYDPYDWRDPFIFWNEDTREYVMILGARKLMGKKIRTGRTVWFTSIDLKQWKFQGDFWAPDLYCMHEMPDLFRIGEYWYLLTTEYSDKSKTVYRMSKSLRGPWLAPVDDAFDGRAYYAARSISDGDKRFLFGWVPTKENESDLANWQWGGTLVVHEVYQCKNNTLGVRPPDGVLAAFTQKEQLLAKPLKLSSVDSCTEMYLSKRTGDLFRFITSVKYSATTRAFGIRLFEDEETGEAYEFIFQVGENRMIFDKTPNLPWFRYMNRGLDRPIHLEPNRFHDIQIIADDTIATIYLDGVSLNTRMYSKAGQSLAIYVIDGQLEIESAAIERIK